MQMLRCSIDIMLFFCLNERGSGWNDESIKDTFPDGQLLEGQLKSASWDGNAGVSKPIEISCIFFCVRVDIDKLHHITLW